MKARIMYVYGTELEAQFPINADILSSKGYIEQSSFDGFDNTCLHVSRKTDVYGADFGQFTFFARAKPGKERYYHDFDFVRNGFTFLNWWNSREFYIFDAPSTSYRRYYRIDGINDMPPGGPDELEDWLVKLGYTCQEKSYHSVNTGGFRFGYSDTDSYHLVTSDIYQKQAYGIDAAFMDQCDWKGAASDAFFNTVAELKFNANNIANLREIAGLASSLLSTKAKVKKFTNAIDKEIGDLWLKYRYVYNTTKSDIEEAARICTTLSTGNTGFLRGSFSVGTVSGRIKIHYQPYENNMLNRILKAVSSLQAAGLDPSLYNLWDMVPFSFIADWFLPIGDTLERASNMKWAATMPYSVRCLVSLKGSVTVGREEFNVYKRFGFTPDYSYTIPSKDGSSSLTWTKRLLDIAALTR